MRTTGESENRLLRKVVRRKKKREKGLLYQKKPAVETPGEDGGSRIPHVGEKGRDPMLANEEDEWLGEKVKAVLSEMQGEAQSRKNQKKPHAAAGER